MVTSAIFSGSILRVNAKINDQLEEEVDVFAARSAEGVRQHFASIAGFQVRRSDLQVMMFGLNNIGLMGVLLFSLYQVVSVEQAAIGIVFSVFSYVTRFQNAVESFPATYVELLRTVEITRRINAVVAAEDEEVEGNAEDGKAKDDKHPVRAQAIAPTEIEARRAAQVIQYLATEGGRR